MKNGLTMIFLLICCCSYGQTFRPGTVYDSVECKDNPRQSYALYLPSDYIPGNDYPVIYIFDPFGQGKTAVEGFKQIADKYGYILACSNNSGSFNFDGSLVAFDNVFKDTRSRFNTDDQNLITAGFEIGARVAAAIGAKHVTIAGTLICGAGLTQNQAYIPAVGSDIDVAILAGELDKNFQEMITVERELRIKDIATEKFLYLGGNEWPSESVLESGVKWLRLNAMKENRLEREEDFIEQFFKEILNKADSLINHEYVYKAWLQYKFLERNFTEFKEFKTDSLNDEIERIETSREFEKALDEREKMRKRELDLLNEYEKALEAINFANLETNHEVEEESYWAEQISMLNNFRSSNNIQRKLLGDRVVEWLTAKCINIGIRYYVVKDYEKAVMIDKIWTIVAPFDYSSHYRLAVSYVFNGEKQEAVKSLRKALRLGVDINEIKQNQIFDQIRDLNSYQRLIKEYTY